VIERSKIYRGTVFHERIEKTSHAFTYPMTFFGFDLRELDEIEKEATLFGHNSARPLSLRDRDYLRGANVSIERQLEEFLGPSEAGQRTYLITSPRYFGSAFNPVNFYLRMSGIEIQSAVAEVNNTFGDRHIYPLPSLAREGESTWSARCKKAFHVSPFNDMAGEYRFTLQFEQDAVFLGVDLWKNGKLAMKTWLSGKAQPITNRRISRYALLRPFDTALNSMPRILWQAGKLYFSKKLQVYKRPVTTSDHTVIDRDHPEGHRPII
jgi:DUF1365 family protein